jgi:hypothetical protein
MFWIYWCIVTLLCLGLVAELFSERSWREQVTAALVLVPVLLRVLLIK